MKTYSAKPQDIVRQWYLVDASEMPLGRLSTVVAELLIGKKKPIFTHHIDCGAVSYTHLTLSLEISKDLGAKHLMK